MIINTALHFLLCRPVDTEARIVKIKANGFIVFVPKYGSLFSTHGHLIKLKVKQSVKHLRQNQRVRKEPKIYSVRVMIKETSTSIRCHTVIDLRNVCIAKFGQINRHIITRIITTQSSIFVRTEQAEKAPRVQTKFSLPECC